MYIIIVCVCVCVCDNDNDNDMSLPLICFHNIWRAVPCRRAVGRTYPMKVKIKNIPEVGFEPTTSGMGVSCTLPLRHSGGVDPRPFIGRPIETVMGRALRVARCALRVVFSSRGYDEPVL